MAAVARRYRGWRSRGRQPEELLGSCLIHKGRWSHGRQREGPPSSFLSYRRRRSRGRQLKELRGRCLIHRRRRSLGRQCEEPLGRILIPLGRLSLERQREGLRDSVLMHHGRRSNQQSRRQGTRSSLQVQRGCLGLRWPLEGMCSCRQGNRGWRDDRPLHGRVLADAAHACGSTPCMPHLRHGAQYAIDRRDTA